MKTYTGKTIQDVLKKVAIEKEVDVESLFYYMVEETAGFLGIGGKVSAFVYDDKDIQQFLYDYLTSYFENIQLKVEIKIEGKPFSYHIKLHAENNAILIGKNGKTLQSLHTILNAAVSSQFKKRIRVMVDVNGYKEEKYQKLCVFAQKVAKSVLQTKTDALLDPMSADERKAIHQHLSKMPHIATKSEGEGNHRRLKIIYKKD